MKDCPVNCVFVFSGINFSSDEESAHAFHNITEIEEVQPFKNKKKLKLKREQEQQHID